MMTYKSGRFWVGKTSFVLPEGSLIDSDYPVDPFFGFVLHPPDMSYRIEFLPGRAWKKTCPSCRESP